MSSSTLSEKVPRRETRGLLTQLTQPASIAYSLEIQGGTIYCAHTKVVRTCGF